MPVKKVLVVDDSPTERHALSEILRRAGYEVNTCDSGEEAVAQSKVLLPDLILMDVVMPGLNGFQATRVIARDDATKHIPVIICTTKSQETDKIWGCGRARATTLSSRSTPMICWTKFRALTASNNLPRNPASRRCGQSSKGER